MYIVYVYSGSEVIFCSERHQSYIIITVDGPYILIVYHNSPLFVKKKIMDIYFFNYSGSMMDM